MAFKFSIQNLIKNNFLLSSNSSESRSQYQSHIIMQNYPENAEYRRRKGKKIKFPNLPEFSRSILFWRSRSLILFLIGFSGPNQTDQGCSIMWHGIFFLILVVVNLPIGLATYCILQNEKPEPFIWFQDLNKNHTIVIKVCKSLQKYQIILMNYDVPIIYTFSVNLC